MSGDGGLSMLLGELITAKMYDLPVKVVVFNNSTLGMVKLEMLVNGLPDFQTDVPDTNYAEIARAIGFHAERVGRRVSPGGRVPRGLRCARPGLVEVITDPNAPLPPAGHHGRPGRRFCDRDEQDRPQPRDRRGLLDGDLQHA